MIPVYTQCRNQLELDRITLSNRLRSQLQSGSPARPDPDIEFALRQMQIKLHRIQEAQARLAAGQFGLCQPCHQPIDAERLLTMPYTELCLECQRQVERKLVRHHPRTRLGVDTGGAT